MKSIAVTGKGGVGKTTIAGILSRLLARDGYEVLAVDADPDLNLGSVLGTDVSDMVPLVEKKELIAERTGTSPEENTISGLFKLNPKVDDVAERFGTKTEDGVNLILMGTVNKGGTGCMCPASAFLRALLRYLAREEGDAIILDMEAGIEHLGRGTVDSVDTLLIVTEPGQKSVDTAERIKKLAKDIGINDFRGIINKTRNDQEKKLIKNRLREIGIPVLGTVPYDEHFVDADLRKKSPLEYSEDNEGIKSIEKIKNKIRKNQPNP